MWFIWRIVYQVGINKGIILRCTAYQISSTKLSPSFLITLYIGLLNLEDGGNTIIRNVKDSHKYTAAHLRRTESTILVFPKSAYSLTGKEYLVF